VTELRVVHGGEPSDDELAAIVAVVTTRLAHSKSAQARALRTPLSPWVASALVKGTRTKA
jgi:hypothetical protein